MSLLDKEPVQRVEKILKDYDESQNIIVLETSARTALEAASSLGCEVGAIVKSLLFKTENSFTLCLVAGDKRASLNRIKKALKIKDASMASAEDVKNITGYTIGGVSPIGHLKKIEILIDKSLSRFNLLFAAAGHPNCVFKIDFTNLKKITNGNHMLTMNDLVGSDAVATWTDPSNPSDIISFSIDKPNKINRLTDVNKDIFYNVEFGEVEEITYKSVDEKYVQGWIVKPPNFDSNKKYP